MPIWFLHKMYILYHLLWIAKYTTLDTTLRTRTQLLIVFSLRYTVHDYCHFERARMLPARVTSYMRICIWTSHLQILLVCLFIWRRHLPHEGLLYSTATAQMSWGGSLSCHTCYNTKPRSEGQPLLSRILRQARDTEDWRRNPNSHWTYSQSTIVLTLFIKFNVYLI